MFYTNSSNFVFGRRSNQRWLKTRPIRWLKEGVGCKYASVTEEHAARDFYILLVSTVFILYGSQQLCDILSHNNGFQGCKSYFSYL